MDGNYNYDVVVPNPPTIRVDPCFMFLPGAAHPATETRRVLACLLKQSS